MGHAEPKTPLSEEHSKIKVPVFLSDGTTTGADPGFLEWGDAISENGHTRWGRSPR
jgi:hypothetical protein